MIGISNNDLNIIEHINFGTIVLFYLKVRVTLTPCHPCIGRKHFREREPSDHGGVQM